jgi:hypothetical protein
MLKVCFFSLLYCLFFNISIFFHSLFSFFFFLSFIHFLVVYSYLATYEALAKYGVDLVNEAASGKLDPVIGRDDEIRRVIRILSRRRKNNPVLIGDPGMPLFCQCFQFIVIEVWKCRIYLFLSFFFFFKFLSVVNLPGVILTV